MSAYNSASENLGDEEEMMKNFTRFTAKNGLVSFTIKKSGKSYEDISVDVDALTVAQLKIWGSALQVPYASKMCRAELVEILGHILCDLYNYMAEEDEVKDEVKDEEKQHKKFYEDMMKNFTHFTVKKGLASFTIKKNGKCYKGIPLYMDNMIVPQIKLWGSALQICNASKMRRAELVEILEPMLSVLAKGSKEEEDEE